MNLNHLPPKNRELLIDFLDFSQKENDKVFQKNRKK